MNTKKNKKGIAPVSAGGGATIQPVNPGVRVQSAASTAQQTGAAQKTASYGRSGVSAQTQQALDSYGKGYTPSAAVNAAQQYLQQVQGQKPGEYQSPYAAQLDELYQQISGRGPFKYDLNADMLYRQYRDQYTQLGQQAMMNTMGQSAGLTGGYGSSYSQNAGQQAYQGYLQQLNDKVPELYDRAYNQWANEGDDLYRRYGLLNDRENTAYGRYRDTVGDWRDELNMAYQRYGDERNFDYGKWGDMRDYWERTADRENSEWWKQTEFDYRKGRDAVADDQWMQQFLYGKERDAVADSQWKQQFDRSGDQWQQEFNRAGDQWQTEFDYQKGRDAVADDQWERQFNAAQAARAASSSANYQKYYQDAYQNAYQAFLDQYMHGNPNYQSVGGTSQGRIEIPGYGTADQGTYEQMLAQGLVGEMKYDKKNGTWSALKKKPITGNWNLIM